MPNCKTCQIKADGLDPGHFNCYRCIESTIAGAHPGHVEIKAGELNKDEYCKDCADNHSCTAITRRKAGVPCFKQRLCGNCGHNETPEQEKRAHCFLLKDIFHPKNRARMNLTGRSNNKTCSWKPITKELPVCNKCGGKGILTQQWPFNWTSEKPCPTCQGEKVEAGQEKRLMMPVKWNSAGVIGKVYQWWLVSEKVGRISSHWEEITPPYDATAYGRFVGQFDTLEAAEAAVEKALGIEEV